MEEDRHIGQSVLLHSIPPIYMGNEKQTNPQKDSQTTSKPYQNDEGTLDPKAPGVGDQDGSKKDNR